MADPKLIYVIDDDTALRTAYAAALTGQGYQVKEATDGVEGLDLIKAQTPDLIVLDMLMPRMSGLDMLKELEQLDLQPKPKIVVISSFESLPDDNSVQVDKYMSKMQFGPDEAVAAIDSLLQAA